MTVQTPIVAQNVECVDGDGDEDDDEIVLADTPDASADVDEVQVSDI